MKEKAKESAHVRKTREKLKQRLEATEKKITPEALRDTSQAIQKWIARHSKDRINLKDKTITLFDENKHSASPHNKIVTSLLKQLQSEATKEKEVKNLSGRISSAKQNEDEPI